MKKSLIATISFLIFVILITEFILNGHGNSEAISTRSIVVVAIVLFCYMLSHSWALSLSIYGKVKVIFALSLLTYAIDSLLKLSFFEIRSAKIDIAGFVIFILNLVFAGLLLSFVKELVVIQRKKSTQRNFIIFLVFLFSFSLFGQKTEIPSELSTLPLVFTAPEVFYMIISLFMIYGMVINSFRLKWIKFLNKGQKIKTLILSILIIIFLGVLIDDAVFIRRFSDIGYRLSVATNVFGIVYFSFSLIVILLHLPTAGSLDRKSRELSSLQQLSRSMVGIFDLEKIFDIILKQTIEITGSNFSWLILKEGDSDQFELVAERGLPERIRNIFSSDRKLTVVKWILEEKNVLMIDRVGKDKRVADIAVWRHKAGSLLAIPLISNEQILGILFAVKNTEYGFMVDDRSLLTMFANNATIAIENAQLVEKSVEKEKYEHELKVAHEAQMKLLPAQTPNIPSLDISAICITANEVGGDYYDFFHFNKNSLGVVIGDVSGKGAEAAFYMAEGKGILESLCENNRAPAELLCRANEVLYKTLDAKTFISMLYGIFDLKRKVLRFARAGHCPLIYWKADEEIVYLVEPSGMALGLISGEAFEKTLDQEEIKYQKGDLFIFCTDGVTEAMNEAQEEFGEDRLCELVADFHEKSAGEIQEAILKEIKNFVGKASQHDDSSLIVIKPK